jgi:hypothetical protein
MARQRRERDSGKERFWRDAVRRWDRSKWTVRDFCAEHGLSEASFYAWRRIIAERDKRAARRSSERDDQTGTVEPPAFVPVRVTPAAPPPALEVVIGAGRVVRVSPGFDAATLRNLLAVLEEVSSC